MATRVQESAEDYLETIYLLLEKNGAVRSVDIAREMGFSSRASVAPFQSATRRGYISMQKCGDILLTDAGKTRASVFTRATACSRIFLRRSASRRKPRRTKRAALSITFPTIRLRVYARI